MGTTFEIKNQQLNLVHIQITAVSKPHGNCKPKLQQIHTHRKSNANTTLKIVIQPPEKRTEGRKTNKNKSKTITKTAVRSGAWNFPGGPVLVNSPSNAGDGV